MPTWLAIVVFVAAAFVLVVGAWIARRGQRKRWEAIESAPETAAERERPAPPPVERAALGHFELRVAMDRAIAWADQAEKDGRAMWRDARGELGPEEYLELFAEVKELLGGAFDDDCLGILEGPPPEACLRVDDVPWMVTLERRDGFLDEAFWTFLNRVLEARGETARIVAPRLATWRIPMVVVTREEIRALREEGLGFLFSQPPLYPRTGRGEVCFHKRPLAEPATFMRELGEALGVGEASAQAALERVGQRLGHSLSKYRLLQIRGFGSFQLRSGGPGGRATVRFRADRSLRQRVSNPVLGRRASYRCRVSGIDATTLQAVLEVAVQQLTVGCGAVRLPGLGLFWRELQPASILRDPQNQQPLMVPARREVAFDPDGASLTTN